MPQTAEKSKDPIFCPNPRQRYILRPRPPSALEALCCSLTSGHLIGEAIPTADAARSPIGWPHKALSTHARRQRPLPWHCLPPKSNMLHFYPMRLTNSFQLWVITHLAPPTDLPRAGAGRGRKLLAAEKCLQNIASWTRCSAYLIWVLRTICNQVWGEQKGSGRGQIFTRWTQHCHGNFVLLPISMTSRGVSSIDLQTPSIKTNINVNYSRRSSN